jgi:hypothetical protein
MLLAILKDNLVIKNQFAKRERNSGSIELLKSNLTLFIPLCTNEVEEIRNPSLLFFYPCTN